MLPRVKPYFNTKEITAAINFRQHNAIKKFEQLFAETFKAQYALSFPYGRSALYSLFKALAITDSEILMSAYTCVVVAHAIVLAGNIPRFVDINLSDYNFNLEECIQKINHKTRAIIIGNTFGYPANLEKIHRIGQSKNILIIQDCAHAFGATWNGKLVCNQSDAAIFSLNISKQLSSIFGGMLITNNEKIYQEVKTFRDQNFSTSRILRPLKSFLYLLLTYPAFSSSLYTFTSLFDYLEETPLLRRMTQYYDTSSISFPKNAFQLLSSLEARVGIAQLKKYHAIYEKREAIAAYYNKHLQNIPWLHLPPLIEGATYSHYVPKTHDREIVIKKTKRQGIQIGKLIEYSIPHMPAYQRYKDDNFTNALQASKTTINLPIYPDLSLSQLKYIIETLHTITI